MSGFCMIVPESPYLFDPWTIEPLGALYLCSAAKEVVSKVYVRVWNQEPLPATEWYGITLVTPHYQQVDTIVRWLRAHRPRSKIILGGAHCTFLPIDTFTELRPDFLVAGEGEYALPSILYWGWTGLSGIYTEIDGKLAGSGIALPADIGSLPIPDHSLLQHKYYPNPAFSDEQGGAITASRGCPFGCTYCGKSVGRAIRWREPASVAGEMELYTQWRFEDDDLFGNPEWLQELARLVPTGREWRCSVRADSVTKEILEIAKRAGCRQVGVGVETASPRLLKIHCPSKKVEESTRAIELIKAAGLKVTAFLIAGLPGETEDTLQETIDWITEVKPDKFTVSACTPYPGSPLYHFPERYGITKLDTGFDNYRQLGREDEDMAFVFDTKWADRYELTRYWKRLREVAQYGIAERT